MHPTIAIRRCRKRYRLVRQEGREGGESCWMVLDETGDGIGVHGGEADGQDYYERVIMFRALEMLDPAHDWHGYDWHSLRGSADDRVARMLAWKREQGRGTGSAARALIDATLRSGMRLR